MVDPRATVGVAFYDVSKQLMTTLSDAWPSRFSKELPYTSEDNLQMMQDFLRVYGHLFEKASRHDKSIFEDPALNQYSDLVTESPETLEVFWQYTDNLVRYATVEKMYKGIPSSVMGIISESITSVKTSLDNGTLDPKYMNPLELGSDVMKKLRPEDLMALTNSLMQNQDEMMGMMSSMMNLMNNLK
jgi:hypothetical protein